MIIKLLPSQLPKYWEMIRFAIAETFIPRNTCTNEHLRWMLSLLLKEKAQCWIVLDGEIPDRKFIGFMITRIGVEQSIGEKTLFVDSIYAYQAVPEKIMFQASAVLDKFAISNNCRSISTITESDRIVMLAQRNGYTKRFLLTKEV